MKTSSPLRRARRRFACLSAFFLLCAFPSLLLGFAGGDGSAENPYQVATAAHLDAVRNHLDAHFVMTANINLGVAPWNEGEGWSPIGTNADRFSGSFNGAGFDISGLRIARPTAEYQGLFGYVEDASIQDLRMIDVSVNGGRYTGALVGYGLRCSIESVLVSGQVVSIRADIGGLAGRLVSSMIHRANLDVIVSTSNSRTGGLAGYVSGGSEIRHCSVSGGILGGNDTGGMVGHLFSGMVSDSYNRASVQGGSHVGGLIGRLGYRDGYITGQGYGHLRRTYSTGAVTGTGSLVGGLIGRMDSGSSAWRSYWDAETSTLDQSAGGIARTTAEMKQAADYESWNFLTLWLIDEGHDYPVFRDLRAYTLPQDVGIVDLEGLGTEASPYILTSADELNAMRQDLSAHYRLGGDIDLSSTVIWNTGRGWEPVGNQGTDERFVGSLDGAGYSISYLVINDWHDSSSRDYKGLIGVVDGASIRNVRLVGINVSGREHIGGLVGRAIESTIEGVSLSGIVVGTSYTGGLTGSLVGSQVQKSSIDLSVFGGSRTGGLAGYVSGGSEIRHCSVSGGILGGNDTGGMVGHLFSGMVSDSYNRASVQGGSHVGGLIGRLGYRDGYITGQGYGHLRRTYSTGAVTGTGSLVGGLIGRMDSGSSAWRSYWDAETSTLDQSAGGIARTTAEMKQAADYESWNFLTLWLIDEGHDYPVFRDLRAYTLPQDVGIVDLEGLGTEASPYILTSADELNAMRQDLSAHYRLGGDIDLSSTVIWNTGRGWEPVGNQGTDERFVGSLDGAGYSISYLVINDWHDSSSRDYKGLIGVVDGASIRNVRLVGINVSGREHIGGLVGRAIESTIEGVSLSGIVVGTSYTGGLTGSLVGSQVQKSSIDLSVFGGSRTGGLAGYVSGGSEIRHCSVSGGILGGNDTGGMVGHLFSGMVSDSYNRASVQGGSHVGGLIGRLGYRDGYITGQGYGHLRRTYSTGAVSGSGTSIGGLIGRMDQGSSTTGGFWDIENSGMETSAGGTAKTTAEMRLLSTYTEADWDVEEVWAIDTRNDGYPWLRALSMSLPILSPTRSGTLVSGDWLRFVGMALDMPDVEYHWNFGDGRESSVRNPGLVSFPVPGVYSVTYTASRPGEDPSPDSREFQVVPDTGGIADLRVLSVSVPSELAVGQVAQVSYTVRNVGQGAASGTWRDAIYLSRDAFPDVEDTRLATVPTTRNLAVGASYHGTLQFTMPAVEEGTYHLILVVNDEWTLLERHRLNNEYAHPITAQVPALMQGTAFAASHGSGQVEQYYRIAASGGPNMVLRTANMDPNLRVYLRYGALPTRSTYDYILTGGEPFVIPAATEGDWYVLVVGDASVPGEYTLQFDMVDLALTGITPSRYGTVADLNLELRGAGYSGLMDVELVAAGGAVYEPASTEVDSYTQMTAHFPAGTVPPGIYTVRATRNGTTVEQANVLEIFEGGEANLEVELILPARFGYHQLATVYVEYSNTGDAPMAAPLLLVSATQNGRQAGIMTLDRDRISKGFWVSAMPDGFSNSVQFLASGEVPGILQPGESHRMPVYYAGWQRPWNFSYPPFEWTVGILDEHNETEIYWPAMKENLRPDYIRSDAWEVVWENFKTLAGTTWGDYISMLSRNALYLHRQGQRVDDIESLLALSFRLAEGLNPMPVLASGADAAVAGPGLAIVFERVYLQYVSRRFEDGSLGRGWSHNWQFHLTKRDDGTVVITDQTGTPRIFQPDSRYSGRYLAGPGDEGDLRVVAGDYRLTEANGLVQVFSSNGHLSYIEDTNANRITAEYSGTRLSRLTHSSGGFLQFSYNAAGRITAVTDEHGRRTQYAYSGEYLTQVTGPDGRIWNYQYEDTAGASQHALRSIEWPDGSTQYYEYDTRGRLVETYRDDEQERITFGYANNGRVLVSDALGNVNRMFFDHWGRLVKAENPLGEAVQMRFDSLGNIESVIDPAGVSIDFAYDRRGNLVEISDALRRTTSFSYHRQLNRLASVTDALNNRTEYVYDGQGNLVSMTYPDGSIEQWTYDAPGNPIRWTNRRGQPIDLSYNAFGRVTSKTFADGAEVTYAYDARGNLIEAEDATGTYTLSYSDTDYLTGIAYPGGRSLEFGYDDVGRRTFSRDQLGYEINYHYDAAGRLARLSNDDGTIVEYAYDALGRLYRKTMGNGVYSLHSYDAAGRLESLVNSHADDTVLSSFTYTYDRRGRRIEMDTHYGVWTYTYDDAGQLLRAVLDSSDPAIPDQDLAYEYDALGNRIRTTVNGVEEEYDANSLNQYTTVGDRTYTYDLDGNLIREEGPDGVTIYTYNDENRLVGVTRGDDTWEYAYDPFGNRVVVDENGVRTHYVIDPVGLGNVVGEYTDAGALVTRYAQGFGLVSRLPADGSAGYYTFDPAGNTSALTGPAGVVHNRYAYQPFGGTVQNVQSVPNPFKFMGQFGIQADAAGLYHVRERQYDPALGRFATVDPIRYASGDMNVYRYAQNNPLSFVDPDGRIAITTLLGYGVKTYFAYRTACKAADLRRASDDLIRQRRAAERETDPLKGRFSSTQNLRDGMAHAEKAIEFVGSAPLGINSFVEGAMEANEIVNATRQSSKSMPRAIGSAIFPCSWNRDPVDVEPDTDAFAAGTSAGAGSWDPNEKIAISGFGPGNHVRAGRTLSYRIDFENYESATAPAQVVTIRDPLSPDLDWSTLEITEIGFGEITVPVPAGRNYFQTVVDYAYTDDDYDFEIEVHIEVWLENGIFHANFLSFDPETGLPPPVDIGFLPPETDPVTGRGRGYVSYLIRPKPNLASGTTIRNIATIQFDFSLEIDTNQVDPLDKTQGTDPEKEALVTIDAGKPTSSASALPATVHTTDFVVSWSGEDDEGGSGIAFYEVYARTGGGGWDLWLTTDETSATFSGENGMTHSFYTVATDNVGYREIKIPVAEASTTVASDSANWFDSAYDLGNGWRYFDWFESFYPGPDGWIYHEIHGWLHVIGETPQGMFIWDAAMDRWFWTNEDIYGWLYLYGPGGGWMLLLEDGYPGNRWFQRGETGQVLSEQQLVANGSGDPGDLVFVQGGTLATSSPLNGAQVQSFYIGHYQVTWGEWQTVRTWAATRGYDIGNRGAGCADDHPVHSVNWFDAVKWCNAKSEMEGLEPVYTVDGEVYRSGEFGGGSHVVEQNLSANGYRLPLEAEWEFAARGGNQTNGYTYAGSNDLNAVGWYVDNSGGAACNHLSSGRGTWPVGQKAANELGLYDMSGNVWEWCWDQTGSFRRIRGGSWDDSADFCTVSYRGSSYPGGRWAYDGFRLARSSGS
jgi:RHS repeat-associated protein